MTVNVLKLFNREISTKKNKKISEPFNLILLMLLYNHKPPTLGHTCDNFQNPDTRTHTAVEM